MEITFYTTHCPKCSVLKKKLDLAKINYNINDNVEEMIDLGLKSAPALKVEDKILNFTEAIEWIKEQNEY